MVPDTRSAVAERDEVGLADAGRRGWWPWLLVGVPAAAHLAIGVSFAGRRSLWGDEAFSAETVRLPLGDLLSMLTHIDINMSAYYLVLKAWSAVFGQGEVALRSLSLVMTTATVMVAGRLLWRWFGSWAAAGGAVTLALSPYFIRIGLTARPFAMLALVCVLATALLVRALGKDRIGPWLLLAVVDALAAYTSLLGVLVIVAQGFYVLAVDRRLCRAQFAAAMLLLVAAIPSLVWIAPADTLNWLGQPSLRSLVDLGYSVIGEAYGLVPALLAAVGLLLRPRASGPLLDEQPRGRLLLPLLVLLPVVQMLVLLPKQSLFIDAYLVNVFVFAAMLAGASIGLLRGWARPVALALLTLSLLGGVVAIVRPEPELARQDWGAAISRLDGAVQPGDAVVFPNTFYRVAGEHYARPAGFTAVAQPRLPADAWFSKPPLTYDSLKRTGAYSDPAVVVAGVRGVTRVWLVSPDGPLLRSFTAALADAGWTVDSTSDVPGVVTRLLVRSG
jgi:hypothetical protein